MALYQIEYDVKQTHMLVLTGSTGDFNSLRSFSTVENAFLLLKSSSKGRLILQKIHFGKFEFDETKTQDFRDSLPKEATGIVLKRKFPKDEKEEYYSKYIYSAWINCEKGEVDGEIEYKLNLNFDPLNLDWAGNQKNILKTDTIKLTSTPIFLIENNGNYPDIDISGNGRNVNDNGSNLNLKIFLITIIFSFDDIKFIFVKI